MSRTLYMTDLDGTLLQPDQKVSQKSCEIINELIEQGMMFSFATARSVHTINQAAGGLNFNLPVILNNGSFITDINTGEKLLTNTFTDEEAKEIYDTLVRNGIVPLVYSLINEKEKFSYDINHINKPLADFIEMRRNNDRDNPITDTSVILNGTKYYFVNIGEKDKLEKAYNELKDKYNCIFHVDIYSREWWLEIMPWAATKANAINQLKEMYKCDTIVTFGDGKNDISMFEIADRCYAVENAVDELKAIATGIIESNINDGVAKFLKQDYKITN